MKVHRKEFLAAQNPVTLYYIPQSIEIQTNRTKKFQMDHVKCICMCLWCSCMWVKGTSILSREATYTCNKSNLSCSELTRTHISLPRTPLRAQTTTNKPSESRRHGSKRTRRWRNCDVTHLTFSTHLPCRKSNKIKTVSETEPLKEFLYHLHAQMSH